MKALYAGPGPESFRFMSFNFMVTDYETEKQMKMMCCVIYHTWKVGIDHFVSNCSRPRRNNSMNYK